MRGDTNPEVCVIGLGYIGLPTAAIIARANCRVTGVDVWQAVVDTINRGEIQVFGDLPFDDSLFTEDTPYAPSSPHSAGKAASDHFVRAWQKTCGLPVVLSNFSNNYGPYHFPEKLIRSSSSKRSKASRWRSTAMATTCVTGCSSTTTPRRWKRC